MNKVQYERLKGYFIKIKDYQAPCSKETKWRREKLARLFT